MIRGIRNTALFVIGSSIVTLTSFASNSSKEKNGFEIHPNTPVITLQTPNLKAIQEQDAINDANHSMYRIAVATQVNITTQNSGSWVTKDNGDRVWQLEISYPGAAGLSFLFERFIVYGNSSLDVFSKEGYKLHSTFDANEVLDHGRQNMELCYGDNMILQLTEPKNTTASEIFINTVHFVYRGIKNPFPAKINESDACQVNANCTPEGTNYKDEKNGVVRIYVVDPTGAGWCSGSVVNNTALDCKPYVLTAFHCGVSSTTANYNQFKFYFGYESANCVSPSTAGTLDNYAVTGCFKLADSNDGGGMTGSDFLLVQMGSIATEATTITKIKGANYKAYWNGWDVTNTAAPSGVSIHHPSGDIKKISTFTTSLVSSTWQSVSGTHWRVKWAATTNGHGVTEGGSSGSPIFTYNNGNSRIVGTLTGGGSYCNATSSPDFYGKMSYHWTSNGSAANRQLKTFLDPVNSGATIFNGSWDPCTGLGLEESALGGIKLYPNPTSSLLTVDVSGVAASGTIQIRDVSGKLLMEKQILPNATNEMNVSELSNGIYFVIVHTVLGDISRKITKL